MKVLAICGSLQAQSSNLDLLRQAAAIAPEGVEVQLSDDLRLLPLFNPDLEPSPAVLAWRDSLQAADAVLIATPEYGHSLPGALKNGIDWVISSGELYRKVVAITAAVKDPQRGLRGLAALQQTLMAVDVIIVSASPVVQGPSAEAELKELLATMMAHPR